MVPISHTTGDRTDIDKGVARDERRRRIAVLIVAALPSVAGAGVAAAVSADGAEADSEGTR
jgi:hypothetical protein